MVVPLPVVLAKVEVGGCVCVCILLHNGSSKVFKYFFIVALKFSLVFVGILLSYCVERSLHNTLSPV